MTVLFVATNGGHLAQLVELAKRIEGLEPDRLWVTFDSPQSRSLLDGEQVRYIRSIEERDVVGVVRGIGSARRILRDTDVTGVISTGSAIALSFLPLAALRGIPAHYIESAARVGRPSLTGRLLERVPGVYLYRQYPTQIRTRWRHIGSVFDGFDPAPQTQRRPSRIVVMLGTGVHSFRRLVDRLIPALPKDADVLWQTGSTPVDDLKINARPAVPAEELREAVAKSDVVVSHAGCGSALLALQSGRFPILVPRRPENHELVDSHQVQLAEVLQNWSLALARDPEAITADDIFRVASASVVRSEQSPMLRLAQG